MRMNAPACKLRIICVSDTHNHAPGEGYTLPKGDILIHAGDLTNQGTGRELKKTWGWIRKADFAVKVVVAGNHDLSLDRDYSPCFDGKSWHVEPDDSETCHQDLATISGITYLQHESAIINIPKKDNPIRIFGSPFSPYRGRQNWAFQYDEKKAQTLWDAIPADTDILISHAPPAGHCDASAHWTEGGCTALLLALWRVKPILHICGHCHEGRGVEILRWGREPGVVEGVRRWEDPGAANKKQSILDLTGARGGQLLEVGKETVVINASVMAKSWGHGGKEFHKPIVVDVNLPVQSERYRELDSGP